MSTAIPLSQIGMPGHRAPGVGFEAPFEMLQACHERVERMLELIQRLQKYLQEVGCDNSARQAAQDVMRYFDLAAPLHHEDEERHVFPPLIAGPDAAVKALVLRLIQDHRQIGRRQLPWPSDDNYPGRWKRGVKWVAQVVERAFRWAGASPC